MTNPSSLVITGLDGYFILNFLQKSGLYTYRGTFSTKNNATQPKPKMKF